MPLVSLDARVNLSFIFLTSLNTFITNNQTLHHFSGIIDFMSILQEHRNYRTISTEEFEEQISDLFYILTRELSSAPSDKIYNDYQVIN